MASIISAEFADLYFPPGTTEYAVRLDTEYRDRGASKLVLRGMRGTRGIRFVLELNGQWTIFDTGTLVLEGDAMTLPAEDG